MPAEFGGPPWAFGLSTYTFLDDGTLVATWHGPEGSGLGIVAGGGLIRIPTPYTSFGQLAGAGDAVLARASSATEPEAVVRVTLDGAMRILRRTQEIDLPLGSVSVPRHLRFPVGAEEAWAWYYPPANADFEGPPGERPPLIVTVHGGPTGSAQPSFDLEVQYWTTRGFALVDVDYRGSTGYGREYRNRLRGNWGVTDVEDVVAVTRWLAAQGWVDGARAVIRGGSAGGYTTLAALAFTDAFAAGASYYGISDLTALLTDDHKFESRYCDTMIGPWPEAAATYRARSPLFHLDGFNRPLLLLQGLEDVVVPPAQSEMIFEALKDKGVPVGYLAFAGEQHGFRRAETIVAATLAELSFYGLVLGFTPDGAVDVPLENFGG
jgi:dipeptidyl aminopeptidase/acylaminoacyl peptidase